MNRSEGKILVIDDQPAARETMESTLRALRFEVGSVATGEEAVLLARTVRYDVVLLAVALPDMMGIAACRELRRLRPRLGILIITAYDSEEMAIRALDAGADNCLTTPFRLGELAARLRALIRRHPTEKMILSAKSVVS